MLANILQKKQNLENSWFTYSTPAPEIERAKAEIVSQNQRGQIVRIHGDDNGVAATYELRLENSDRCITFTLYHLRKMCADLEERILSTAQAGELLQSDSLLKRRKNVDLKCYTHRLKITVDRKSFDLKWLIDVDFSTAYSYGTSHAKKILDELLIETLNELKNNAGLSLDDIGRRDWCELIRGGLEKSLGSAKDNQIRALYQTRDIS